MTLELSFSDKISIIESQDIVTVDTEGVAPMLGLSFCTRGMPQGFYLPFRHSDGNNLSKTEQEHVLKTLQTKTLVHHNAAHDCMILEDEGMQPYEFFDTMLMAHWINEEMFNYSLDSVSRAYGGKPKNMPLAGKQTIEEEGWGALPLSIMDEYSSNDAFITDELFWKLKPKFDEQFPPELWAVEQDFIRYVIIPMKRRGIKVDMDFIVKEFMRGDAIMNKNREELKFNPASSKDLERILIDELGLPVVGHTKSCKKCYPDVRYKQSLPVGTHQGKPSFDKTAMEEYDFLLEKSGDERAKRILEYRGWQKTNSSNYKAYMRLADSEHILRPNYKLHGTKTGRLSCEDPNLQQIPKSSDNDWNGHLKQAFIPREGFDLWSVDYSQLQFRMTCAYAGQMDLIDIFNDPARDIFSEMGDDMSWIRDNVKTLVYLILFGGGGKRASVAFSVPRVKGNEIVEQFNTLYPEIKKVSKDCENAARRQGYVTYWTGRRRHFGRGSAYYRAFNSVIQGGEAEIIKRAMVRIAKEVCDENCYLVLQIHDEVVPEIRSGMADIYIPRIQKIMSEVTNEFCEYVGVKVEFRTSANPWGKK